MKEIVEYLDSLCSADVSHTLQSEASAWLQRDSSSEWEARLSSCERSGCSLSCWIPFCSGWLLHISDKKCAVTDILAAKKYDQWLCLRRRLGKAIETCQTARSVAAVVSLGTVAVLFDRIRDLQSSDETILEMTSCFLNFVEDLNQLGVKLTSSIGARSNVADESYQHMMQMVSVLLSREKSDPFAVSPYMDYSWIACYVSLVLNNLADLQTCTLYTAIDNTCNPQLRKDYILMISSMIASSSLPPTGRQRLCYWKMIDNWFLWQKSIKYINNALRTTASGLSLLKALLDKVVSCEGDATSCQPECMQCQDLCPSIEDGKEEEMAIRCWHKFTGVVSALLVKGNFTGSVRTCMSIVSAFMRASQRCRDDEEPLALTVLAIVGVCTDEHSATKAFVDNVYSLCCGSESTAAWINSHFVPAVNRLVSGRLQNVGSELFERSDVRVYVDGIAAVFDELDEDVGMLSVANTLLQEIVALDEGAKSEKDLIATMSAALRTCFGLSCRGRSPIGVRLMLERIESASLSSNPFEWNGQNVTLVRKWMSTIHEWHVMSSNTHIDEARGRPESPSLVQEYHAVLLWLVHVLEWYAMCSERQVQSRRPASASTLPVVEWVPPTSIVERRTLWSALCPEAIRALHTLWDVLYKHAGVAHAAAVAGTMSPLRIAGSETTAKGRDIPVWQQVLSVCCVHAAGFGSGIADTPDIPLAARALFSAVCEAHQVPVHGALAILLRKWRVSTELQFAESICALVWLCEQCSGTAFSPVIDDLLPVLLSALDDFSDFGWKLADASRLRLLRSIEHICRHVETAHLSALVPTIKQVLKKQARLLMSHTENDGVIVGLSVWVSCLRSMNLVDLKKAVGVQNTAVEKDVDSAFSVLEVIASALEYHMSAAGGKIIAGILAVTSELISAYGTATLPFAEYVVRTACTYLRTHDETVQLAALALIGAVVEAYGEWADVYVGRIWFELQRIAEDESKEGQSLCAALSNAQCLLRNEFRDVVQDLERRHKSVAVDSSLLDLEKGPKSSLLL